MDEQNKATATEKSTGADENSGSGVQSQTETFLNKIEELKQVDASIKQSLAEMKELRASELLGSSAGIRKTEPVHVETAKEYAERVMNNKI
jgi:hypothetical protein